MSEELILFLASVYSEAFKHSEGGWKAIAHTMKNRFWFREWQKYPTLYDLLTKSGFEANFKRSIPYRRAYAYFSHERNIALNTKMEDFYDAVLPIYDGRELAHDKYVLYYSPKSQKFLHDKDPGNYMYLIPPWATSPLLTEVKVPGCENDDLIFFKYVQG